MSVTEQEAIDKKEERVMHRGTTQRKAILAGFVIAGALVLALPLPSQAQMSSPAQEKTFAGKSISHPDPHYLENKADLQLKMDVKWHLALSPWVDADFLHVHVRDGVVTLRGVVEDESAVAAAVRNAKTAGAKEVINKLTTENEK